MADITQLRFAQFLKKALGLKAIDPGQVVAHGVVATMDIQDPYRPENRSDRGEKLFGVGFTATNTAAVNFGAFEFVNPTGSSRLAVLKRITFGINMPTSTNQPGNVYLDIAPPATPPTTPTTFGLAKDARYGQQSTATQTASGVVGITVGAATPIGVYHVPFFTQSTVVPTLHQGDNLDIVVTPGTFVVVRFAADTLPVATYSWFAFLEGYERTADPSEFLAPPP